MFHFLSLDLSHWIASYGYWVVFFLVAIESMGVPVPGETVLIGAAAYAGTTQDLGILGVLLSGAAGAVVGDNLGYWIGRQFGVPLLLRQGRRIGLTEPRLKLGQYLFSRYGGAIVFFGRFVALLRTLAALLAGANFMPWPRFLIFNMAGGVIWTMVFALGGYAFGASMHRVSGPIGIVLLILAIAATLAGFILIRRNEVRLLLLAEQALPGPLRARSPSTRNS
jgi:membrane protein DedA with SNARE-associated domain